MKKRIVAPQTVQRMVFEKIKKDKGEKLVSFHKKHPVRYDDDQINIDKAYKKIEEEDLARQNNLTLTMNLKRVNSPLSEDELFDQSLKDIKSIHAKGMKQRKIILKVFKMYHQFIRKNLSDELARLTIESMELEKAEMLEQAKLVLKNEKHKVRMRAVKEMGAFLGKYLIAGVLSFGALKTIRHAPAIVERIPEHIEHIHQKSAEEVREILKRYK